MSLKQRLLNWYFNLGCRYRFDLGVAYPFQTVVHRDGHGRPRAGARFAVRGQILAVVYQLPEDATDAQVQAALDRARQDYERIDKLAQRMPVKLAVWIVDWQSNASENTGKAFGKK